LPPISTATGSPVTIWPILSASKESTGSLGEDGGPLNPQERLHIVRQAFRPKQPTQSKVNTGSSHKAPAKQPVPWLPQGDPCTSTAPRQHGRETPPQRIPKGKTTDRAGAAGVAYQLRPQTPGVPGSTVWTARTAHPGVGGQMARVSHTDVSWFFLSHETLECVNVNDASTSTSLSLTGFESEKVKNKFKKMRQRQLCVNVNVSTSLSLTGFESEKVKK